MVRTLPGPLSTALAAHTRAPALVCQIADQVLHYGTWQTPNQADAWIDAAVMPDGSIVRTYISRGSVFGGTVYHQRISDPTQASQWLSWNSFPGNAGQIYEDGGLCVSYNAASSTVRIFAQVGTGGNQVINWWSTDNGQTWSGPATVVTPPGGALTHGLASAGNNDLFLIYDVVGGSSIGYEFYNGSSWNSLVTWSLPPISTGAGLAAAYVGSVYTLVYTDGYTLSCATYDGHTTWTALPAVTPATSTALGRISPRLVGTPATIGGSNTTLWNLVCVEFDTGALTQSVYSYPRIRQSVDLLHWSNGLIVPDLPTSFGCTLIYLPVPNSGTAGARAYLTTMAATLSAQLYSASNSFQFVDVSGSALSYKRSEQPNKPGELQIVLDNNKGQYNGLVALPLGGNNQPISQNATIALSEGYKPAGQSASTIAVGQYHIEQVHVVRTPDANQITIVALDLTRNLDTESRYQFTYANQTVSWLITEICARAGLFSLSLPATAQMSNQIATFILAAGQTYRKALDEVMQTYQLYYFLDQNETLQVRELSGSDASVWSYQPEIESISFGDTDQHRNNHVIVSGKPPTGGQPYAILTAETTDAANLHLVGLERLLHHKDYKLTTAAECQSKAAFLLADEQRSQVQHVISVPLNPALQLLDVITTTDYAAPQGSGLALSGRIMKVEAEFDAQKALDEIRLTLGGV